jgi:hypothetical protein
MKFTRTLATAVAIGALSLGGTAYADETPPADNAPCAKEQAKVDKAEDALARVTAVFARQKDKLADAQAELAAAETDKEKAKAQKKVDFWTAKAAKTKKEKKAQKQRLAKAQQRLEDCEAEQPAT